MGFISAKVLFKNEEFLACTKSALVNSALVNNDPKVAWIFPNGYGYYQLTFTDPADSRALTGVWVTEGAQGMLLDGTLASVQSGLSACCSADPTVITPVYNGVFPSAVDRTVATYTFTRTDDGDIGAMQDFALAYLPWLIPGTLQRTTYSSGVSTYTFQSYTDPIPQGNDSKTGETARLFLSNAPGALTSGNKFSVATWINGSQVGPTISGATDGALTTLPALLAANATLGALGTWSVVSGAIQLSTTTQDAVSIVVTQAV